MDKLDLCTKALSLRKELGEDTDSPIDIFSLVHTISNLTLVFYPMGENLSGICIKNDGNPVIAINSAMSVGRQRFSMAHELYHLYFDTHRASTICELKIGIGNEIEKRADQFASYFLMPPTALASALQKNRQQEITIRDIVRLEQYFGISRQALLYRLVGEKRITLKQADVFKCDVIQSAINLGYDDVLYQPLQKSRQYKTLGHYIQYADLVHQKQLVSNGKYEQLLLTAFRADLVYGIEIEEGEVLND